MENNMPLAILLTILPSILLYPLFNNIAKSRLLKLSFSWFCGQFIITLLTFLIAVILNLLFSNVLTKAVVITTLILIILLIIISKQINHLILNTTYTTSIVKILILLLIFIFSWFFYSPHLTVKNGTIYTSPVYWDFKWHAPLIQNFVYGDNFPPQNESFSGLPQTYHFFWGFLVAVYSAAGLGLISAVNFISILSLSFLLISVIGLSEELFDKIAPGLISILLIITSSSFHFVHYFLNNSHLNIGQLMLNIFTNTQSPYFFSFIHGNPYSYNGTMTNMFYFLAERQMVPGIILLLFFIFILYKLNAIPKRFLTLIGFLLGFFILWHLYITIMVLCALGFLLIFSKNRVNILYLFIPFISIFLLILFYFKNLTNSVWFDPIINTYPRLNFNFTTMGWEYAPSIYNIPVFLNYYFYAYGIKIIFLLIGLIILFKKNKKLFIIFLSILIPSFLLINTVQLSPLSIYDNHKWFRPMNVIIDLVAGYAFYSLFSAKKTSKYIILNITFLILLTLSGIIELMPFLNSKPTKIYAEYNSPLIIEIRKQTAPKSVFLAPDRTEIQLAGRKVFLGDYSGQDLGLNTDLRMKIIYQIYTSDTLKTFCALTHKYKIDYVEGNINISLPRNSGSTFSAIDGGKHKHSFINTSAVCQK